MLGNTELMRLKNHCICQRSITLVSSYVALILRISHNICPLVVRRGPPNQHNGPTSLDSQHRQDSPSFA